MTFMKRSIAALFAGALFLTACGNQDSAFNNNVGDSITIAEERVQTTLLKNNESTLPYDGGILISNFGADNFNPLNQEGKGFIAYYKNDSIMNYIPADGNLSAPKGMQVVNGYLFVSDVGKVVAYKLGDTTVKPINIPFPRNENFVNDIASDGTTLYVSVVNTGNVYRIDASDVNRYNSLTPIKYTNVPGANGLLVHNGKLYIASYPPDGATTEANVVYVVDKMNDPKPEKFITTPGQYDGLAISGDGNTLYVTNWDPVAVQAINMATKEITKVELENPIESAADLSIDGDWMYIPDLVGSKLIIRALNQN